MGQAAGDWVLGMLGNSSTQQRHLLQVLAHGHLRGRSLLLGNPVVLPLLGRSCLFQVSAQGCLAPCPTYQSCIRCPGCYP